MTGRACSVMRRPRLGANVSDDAGYKGLWFLLSTNERNVIMARRPISMRKTKEIRRLKHELGLTNRQIAASLHLGHTCVGQHTRHAIDRQYPKDLLCGSHFRFAASYSGANPLHKTEFRSTSQRCPHILFEYVLKFTAGQSLSPRFRAARSAGSTRLFVLAIVLTAQAGHGPWRTCRTAGHTCP